MSRDIEEVKRMFAQRLTESGNVSFYGSIVSVDEESRTCVVAVGGIKYYNVLLYAIENSSLKGFVFIPKVESGVIISRIGSSNRMFVELFSEIDKVIFTIGEKQQAVIHEGKVEVVFSENHHTLIEEERVEFTLEQTKVVVEKDKIEISADDSLLKVATAGMAMTKGSAGLKQTLSKLCDAIGKLTVPTGVGPSGTPINITEFTDIKSELNDYLN